MCLNSRKTLERGQGKMNIHLLYLNDMLIHCLATKILKTLKTSKFLNTQIIHIFNTLINRLLKTLTLTTGFQYVSLLFQMQYIEK